MIRVLLLVCLAGCLDTDPTFERCDGSDNDADGLVDEPYDADLDGWFRCAVDRTRRDCNDLDARVHPEQPEVCNGRDDDCNGVVPEHERDLDGDGVLLCEGDCDDHDPAQNTLDRDGDGATTCDPVAPDCDDFNPDRSPAQTEACNGIDDDCDRYLPWDEVDADADGESVCEGDCDDANPLRGGRDADGDGTSACDPVAPDCDDRDPGRSPALVEVCDGRDNDCTGLPDPRELDEDSDGLRACGGDCDDRDPTVGSGMPELCDGKDNDCDGVVPMVELDLDGDLARACADDCDDHDPDLHGRDEDGDGWSPCARDCDDADGTILPGIPERCDGRDTDCDGALPWDEVDGDGDGQPTCDDRDCDDTNPDAWRGAPEICDGRDNDCDGRTPTDEVDADADGWRACAAGTWAWDCDDERPDIHPGLPDVCDGEDDDCDGVVDLVTWHLDGDEDGVGGALVTDPATCDEPWPGVVFCIPGADGSRVCWSVVAGDCDDATATSSPQADERCADGVDNDCDGRADETPCR